MRCEIRKNIFFENFFEKICSIQINVLPLHRKSEMTCKDGGIAQLVRASDS